MADYHLSATGVPCSWLSDPFSWCGYVDLLFLPGFWFGIYPLSHYYCHLAVDSANFPLLTDLGSCSNRILVSDQGKKRQKSHRRMHLLVTVGHWLLDGTVIQLPVRQICKLQTGTTFPYWMSATSSHSIKHNTTVCCHAPGGKSPHFNKFHSFPGWGLSDSAIKIKKTCTAGLQTILKRHTINTNPNSLY